MYHYKFKKLCYFLYSKCWCFGNNAGTYEFLRQFTETYCSNVPTQQFSDSRQKQQFTSGNYNIPVCAIEYLTSISARDAMIFTILEEMRADKATIKATLSTEQRSPTAGNWRWWFTGAARRCRVFSSHSLQTIKLTQLLEREHPRLLCGNIHESIVSACVSFFYLFAWFLVLYVHGNL